MELTELLSIHSILVKAFLGFLVLGLIGAIVSIKSEESFKKFSFVYTLIFQLIITLIALVGFVALYEGNLSFGISEIVMIIAWVIIMFVEIKRNKAVKSGALTLKEQKSNFVKTSTIEIIFVVALVVMMILKAKGVIAI